jgi:hypothetical protein
VPEPHTLTEQELKSAIIAAWKKHELHKLEPKELANVPAQPIAALLDNEHPISKGMQRSLAGVG